MMSIHEEIEQLRVVVHPQRNNNKNTWFLSPVGIRKEFNRINFNASHDIFVLTKQKATSD